MASWTSDLALSRDLLADVNGHVQMNGKGSLRDVQAVILAGGRGTRLAPYTSVLPKPLMPIGDQSILEVVVGQLEDAGIVNVNFCVGYLAHLIQAVFDSRENGHVDITYVREKEALGTAGPLRLVEGLDSTFIVMNGDVLTTIDYEELVRFHREQGNAVTIATRERSIKIDYGLLHLDEDSRVREYEEKPTISSRVSMGIYVMEPEVIELVPEGEYFDFPDLVRVLLDAGEPVGAYDHTGLWFDIGRQEDYESAIKVWLEDEEHANGNGNGNGNGAHESNGNGVAPHLANGNGAAHRAANGNGTAHHGTNGNSRLSRLRRLRAAD
jgi:NDP-sugar pyrophosphorylase family protein